MSTFETSVIKFLQASWLIDYPVLRNDKFDNVVENFFLCPVSIILHDILSLTEEIC